MCHLQASPFEATLDVKALVVHAAVENGLVAPDLLADEVEGLNDAQAKLLAPMLLVNRDVLDVADQSQTVDTVAEERNVWSAI